MLNKDGWYEFRGFTIDPTSLESIRDYVEHGADPGSFLAAIICNDLKATVAQADDTNMANIPAFVCYFYNEVPSDCWGSSEKMIKHMAKKAVQRAGV